ncbi:MAG: hypothetical protein GXO77_00290 [Calditrichaeota bacterium]|nr:hypothetical protein [Calditrichota bacterium]
MTKINQLIKQWHKGTVMTLGRLKELGINRDLVKRYKKSGWIESIGCGAYKLAGDSVEWLGAVYGLQQQMNVHIGGKTALTITGYAHYLVPNVQEIYLFSESEKRLPKWFNTTDWNVKVYFKNLKLFNQTINETLIQYSYKTFGVQISAPERAILEMLYDVPERQGFDEAMKIMEALTSLRHGLVQRLLEACTSIKVKRLFLYMAEKQNHFWFNQLNLSKINLGSGKRMIVKNGMMDKKYLITVPKESVF